MTQLPSSGPVTLTANLDSRFLPQYAYGGQIASPLIPLDFCGPPDCASRVPQMIEKDEFDIGEIAIVTYLQAKCAASRGDLAAVNLGRFLFNTISSAPEQASFAEGSRRLHIHRIRSYADDRCGGCAACWRVSTASIRQDSLGLFRSAASGKASRSRQLLPVAEG